MEVVIGGTFFLTMAVGNVERVTSESTYARVGNRGILRRGADFGSILGLGPRVIECGAKHPSHRRVGVTARR